EIGRAEGSGQRFTNLYQSEPNSRLDGSKRLFEALCDLGVRQALVVCELDGDALQERQFVEYCPDSGDALCACKLQLGRGRPGVDDRCGIPPCGGGVRTRLPCAQPIDRPRARDDEKPCRDGSSSGIVTL